MSKLLDKYIKEDELFWPLWTESYMFDYKDDEISEIEKSIIEFVSNKLSFGYSDPYNNDFNPMVQFNGKRSIIFTDLKVDDFESIKNVISNTTNIFLLAKCNDLLFIHTSEEAYCVEAVKNHLLVAERFLKEDNVFGALPFIKRSLFLLKTTSNHKEIANIVDKFVFTNTYSNSNDLVRVINAIFDFFKKCSYTKYSRKKLIDSIITFSITDSDDGLELMKNVIDYYSSIHDSIFQNTWRNKYADMCVRLCKQQSPRGYKYIEFAIDILSRQAGSNEERINNLRFELEEEQKRFFDSIEFEQIPIEGKINDEINDFLRKAVDAIKNESDSIRKFIRFLEIFQPVKEKELNAFAKGMEESAFEGLFSQVIFGKDKRIVDEIGPDDKEKRTKQHIVQAYHLFHAIYYQIALGYFNSVTADDKLDGLIAEIVSHNEFVPRDRVKVVKDFIVDGLNKSIRQSVYNLISQFEFGCVDYLKNKKKVYPVITKGSMTVSIDLNHILTDDKFRKHIADILGEDLTKELQFLLVEKCYGNLRNQNYHEGIERKDAFTNIEILAFYRLINAYCLGYDCRINANEKELN